MLIPHAVFLGPGATRSAQAKTILRALMAAHVPFVNSHTSVIAFMDRANLVGNMTNVNKKNGLEEATQEDYIIGWESNSVSTDSSLPSFP